MIKCKWLYEVIMNTLWNVFMTSTMQSNHYMVKLHQYLDKYTRILLYKDSYGYDNED